MKKRILCVVLAMCLGLSMAACSEAPEESSQVSSAKPASTISSVVSVAPSDPPVSSEALSKVAFSFKGLKFQVPETWRSKESDSGDSLYFYPPYPKYTSMMMVQVVESEYQISFENESYRNEFIKGMAGAADNYVALSTENMSIGDCIGFKHTYSANVSDLPADCTLYSVSTGGFIINFVGVISKDADDDTEQDLNEKLSDVISSLDLSGLSTLPESTPEPTSTPEPAPTPEPISAGKSNALGKAHDYLRIMNFSYQGLIEQLEYEEFSHEDAVYAADNCGADWNEQALGKAKSYLKSMAFSYTGLIEQLEYEGFTSEQATYGVDNCGADWNEQAVKKAESYLDSMSFSRDGLIDQLEYEGFTHEQAVYGVDSVGL